MQKSGRKQRYVALMALTRRNPERTSNECNQLLLQSVAQSASVNSGLSALLRDCAEVRTDGLVEIIVAVEVISCYVPSFRDRFNHRTLDVPFAEEDHIL